MICGNPKIPWVEWAEFFGPFSPNILTRETPSPPRLFQIRSDVLLGFPTVIAQRFSGLQMAVEPNRVEFSRRGNPSGLPRRRFVRLVGRDHDAVVRRLGADEPESGECSAVGEEAAP